MNKNILQFCLSPDLGGLELYVKRIAHFLKSNQNVITILNQNGKLKNEFIKEQLPYIEIKRKSALFLYFTARQIARIINDNKIDIIHVHWTKDIPIAVLAKLFSKRDLKLIQTRHMTMTRFKDDFYHKFLYKNIDLMIAVTKQVKEQIEKFIPADIIPKVVVSYIGAKQIIKIKDNMYQSLRNKYKLNSSFTVGIIGRIEKGKGQYLLIDAINRLKIDSINIKVLIIGHAMDESYLNQLKQNIISDNLEQNIIFTGFISNVQELMQICDTVVLCTQKETFGLVLIEAMQCEISVISSNSGGPLEIVDDNETGLLFKSLDSSSLADKIKLLYENRQLKKKLAINGKNKAIEQFNDIKQFNEVLKILESI